MAKVAIRLKGQDRYRFNTRSTRAVQLSTHNMTDSVHELTKNFSEDEAAQFYQGLKHANGIVNIKKYVEEKLETAHKVGKLTGEGGSFQPLGHYEKLGYDTQSIKDNCKDKMRHHLLGDVYKVDILSIQRYRDEWKLKKKGAS